MEQRGEHASHLFTLRIWQEELGNGEVEWRSRVQHVMSREVRYFRDWPSLIAFLLALSNSVADVNVQTD
jgi:hypothetical protein